MDDRTVVLNFDSTCGTDFFASATANTAVITGFSGICTFFCIGATHNDSIAAVMQADDVLNAHLDAFTATGTHIFINRSNTIWVQGDGMAWAYGNTSSTSQAAIRAGSMGIAASVTGNEGRPVWKLLFHNHINLSSHREFR